MEYVLEPQRYLHRCIVRNAFGTMDAERRHCAENMCTNILWLNMTIEKDLALVEYIVPWAAYMPKCTYVNPLLIKFHRIQMSSTCYVVKKALGWG